MLLLNIWFDYQLSVHYNLFFFAAHAHHRDLLSFPTRRSSDLRERMTAEILSFETGRPTTELAEAEPALVVDVEGDRKCTRLNSSHGYISYAVFCLKKKKKIKQLLKHKEKLFFNCNSYLNDN